jgi:hypothetical protein
MEKSSTERFNAAWENLTPAQRIKFAAELIALSNSINAADRVGKMGRFSRLVFIAAIIAYAAFFLWIADRFPQVAFAAGVLLGAVLIAVWLVRFFRNK